MRDDWRHIAQRWRGRLAAVCLALGATGTVATHAQERVDLLTRPGVTQPIYVTAAPSPVASAMLFPGSAAVAT